MGNVLCANKVFFPSPPPSGMRSPSPSCVTSCGSWTRRRTSSGRRWFAGTRRTARDCRRRCGSTERLLRGFASSEQDYCPLVGWRKWLGFLRGGGDVFLPLRQQKVDWEECWCRRRGGGGRLEGWKTLGDEGDDLKRAEERRRAKWRVNKEMKGPIWDGHRPAGIKTWLHSVCSHQRFSQLCHTHPSVHPLLLHPSILLHFCPAVAWFMQYLPHSSSLFFFYFFKLVNDSRRHVEFYLKLFQRSVHIFFSSLIIYMGGAFYLFILCSWNIKRVLF